MRKIYVVILTDDERSSLLDLTKKGTASARKIGRAQILLHAADGASDDQIASAVRVGRSTVERTRKRFIEGGIECALNEQPRPGAKRKLDGRQEALLIATACSSPPQPRARWTMQLLADKLVELKVVETISDETVRRTLKRGS
jgi:transposase